MNNLMRIGFGLILLLLRLSVAASFLLGTSTIIAEARL
jgi:hypothetical protein